jgi:carbonic anhydrase/acetyltransferase-like protein (isoleucine patch superfamily)
VLALIHRAVIGGSSRLRNALYRALGVRLDGYVWMRDIEIPRNWGDVTLERDVALDRGVLLLCSGRETGEKLIIRSGTYVNRYTILDAHERLEIGRRCLIGPHCFITDGNHGIAAGMTLVGQPMTTAPVHIADDVWIGAGVVILPGVRIATGAVIGAGSVVTRDVPANAIAVGIPAQVIRFRS